jgi:hypothetical protein
MSYGNELAQIDFASMIGGPLDAVIRAQAQAAMTTVDFIKNVGFNKDGVANEVTFRYRRPGEGATGTGQEVEHTLTVPLLTIVPVPFIRVDETVIDFKAKITGVKESENTTTHNASVQAEASVGFAVWRASLKASYSFQSSSRNGSKEERTYALNVRVRAVQDQMPAGLERVLGILENSIKDKTSGGDKAEGDKGGEK